MLHGLGIRDAIVLDRTFVTTWDVACSDDGRRSSGRTIGSSLGGISVGEKRLGIPTTLSPIPREAAKSRSS